MTLFPMIPFEAFFLALILLATFLRGFYLGRSMRPRPVSRPDQAAAAWALAYPDRRPWGDLDQATRDEWLRVFALYEGLAR